MEFVHRKKEKPNEKINSVVNTPFPFPLCLLVKETYLMQRSNRLDSISLSLSFSRCVLDDTRKLFSISMSHSHCDAMLTCSTRARDISKGKERQRRKNEETQRLSLLFLLPTSRRMPWLWSTKDDSVPSDTYSLEESNLIEGISDDTILLVIFTISLICLWAYYST